MTHIKNRLNPFVHWLHLLIFDVEADFTTCLEIYRCTMWDFAQIHQFWGGSKVHCCLAKTSLKKCIEVLWMCFQQWNINIFSCSQCSPYSLKCDLLWSTSWILLQARRWSSCTPLQEHGEWSTVPRVARKAILHSGSVPRMSPGSISLRHPSRLNSFSLHCSSSKLQQLVWKVFSISLVKKRKVLFIACELLAENWRRHKSCLTYSIFAARTNTHCLVTNSCSTKV